MAIWHIVRADFTCKKRNTRTVVRFWACATGNCKIAKVRYPRSSFAQLLQETFLLCSITYQTRVGGLSKSIRQPVWHHVNYASHRLPIAFLPENYWPGGKADHEHRGARYDLFAKSALCLSPLVYE